MQLTVNLSHRGVLERSDAAVRFVTGASEAQNLSQNIVVSPKQMLWTYRLHKDSLIGAKSVTGIFPFQVQCASCACETESQRNN